MSIDGSINRLVQKVQKSGLSEEDKAKVVRILEAIRAALHAIRRFIRNLIAFVKAHKDAARILTVALLVAILAKMIPLIGDVLAFLAILVGAGAVLVAEIRRALNGLLTFDLGVEK